MYPTGQGWVGVTVRVLVPPGLEGDAPADTAGDAVTAAEVMGLPETDNVTLVARLPEPDEVYDGDALSDGDADDVYDPVPDALGVGFKTATLRAVIVALDTPASLASQE